MSTNKKQDVWCWEFAKIDWKQSRSIDLTPRSRNVFIACTVCWRAPSSKTHSSETPMKGLFNPMLQIFFPFFFLLITERVVWEVTSQQSFLWFCLSDLQSSGLCLHLSPEITHCYEPSHTHAFSCSPFQNHLCYSSLPVCWPEWNSFLKGCLESSLRNRTG